MRPKIKLLSLECIHCKKSFQKYPSQIKANKTVFCGNQCVIEYRKIHWQGKIERKCIECGKEFKIYKSEINKCKTSGKYCSKSCQSKRHKFIRCIGCNKKFKIYLSDLNRGNKRFCSQKCYISRTNILDNFFNNININKYKDNCWEWKGRKDKDGYGLIAIRQNVRAHRFSYEFHNKISAGEMMICHKCDNPKCVNPDHLYAGTALDNARDRKERGGY